MTEQKKFWTVKDMLSWMTAKFASEKISTPLLDAQILLCHALKFKHRIDLYLKSTQILKSTELDILRKNIKRRLQNEPVAYIINQKVWFDLDLYVDSSVLIPRPETETLCEFIIETSKQIDLIPKIVFDFCTGSGCIAIALAKQFPSAQIVAFDISKDALDIAQKNAENNNVSNIRWILTDLQDDSSFIQCFEKSEKPDIIVANPPYVSEIEWETLAPEVKNYEPKLALFSEKNGLELGQKIFDNVNTLNMLNSKGIFGMELAHDQPKALLSYQNNIKTLSARHSYFDKPHNEWFVLKDLENKERFLMKIKQ